MSGISNFRGGKKSYPPPSHKRPKNRRRISALSLLEAQLKSGVKTVKGTFNQTTELLPSDIVRIKKQIGILKTKIVG
jgi:hypothetical protein